MKSFLSFIIVLVGILPLLSQQTKLVPQDFSTIQSALNASQSGDVVLVSPGVYYENIIWYSSKDGVEMKSTDGAANTIIDANLVGRALHFDGEQNIDKTTIIDGFTLRNGFINSDFAYGAGVFVDEASPTLRNLIIEDNRITSERANGGGISFNESLSTIENCIIRKNSIVSDGWADGGGIYIEDSNLDFHNCIIQNNSNESTKWSYGGGINIDRSDVQLINCTIEGNTTNGGGWSYGAGIKIYGSFSGMIFDVDLIGCTITNNSPLGSRKYGSGLYATNDVNVNIINSIIHNNGPSTSTVYLEVETVNIINSTIANNQSGIRTRELDLNITNSILWNNDFTIIDDDWIEGSNISVDHSIIEGGYFGPGNIDSDPLFYSDELLIPTENSPCLNAGNKNIPMNIDIVGNERPFPRGSSPDIGAYEINQNFAHVQSRFFYDENNNGIQDSSEEYIGRGAILVDDETKEENTASSGIFSLVQPGTVKINYNDNNTGNWILTSPVSEYIFDVTVEDFADSISFGIYPSREIKSLITGIYGPELRCNRTRIMDFFVKNEGSTREDGILWAQLDPLVSEIMPIQTPDYIDGDRYGWDFVGLLPGESFTRNVSFKIPGVEEVEQGQLLKFTAEASVLSDPNCISFYTYEDEVRCSYDPNDKLVNPDREDQLILRDQDVTYTIRFQNVGNDYADDVVVVDTLDSHFDYSTFKLLKSSHPDQLRYTLSPNGVVNFDFHQIYLPDSTTDEQGSNGYVMYSIRSDSTLADFIEVENTAYIYFDFNPAIVTNTTINSVVEEFPVSTKDEEVNLLEVYPNPSRGQFNLPIKFDHIEVLDESGKYIKSIQNTSKFDLSESIDGIYFIRAVKDTEVFLGKVVLLRN